MKKLFQTLVLACSLTASAQSTLPVYLDESQPIDARVQDALARMTLEEKCRMTYAQSKFTSPGCPRLGIPEIYMSDGPHGVRMEINWNDWAHAGWTNDAVTAFPALTCLASTWNTDLAALYGKSVGEEARYRKKDILLGPGVNLYRTPLNGRNFEYMGEDPYLASRMCVPYIKGLQSNGVACCIKHYILNDQEEFRGHVDVKVSDRALHELYLEPFKAAVQEADAWSLMGSYNKYRGIHNTHNPYLINQILKRDLGFKGAVITDWGAAHDTKQSVFYGLDIEMGSYTNGLTSEADGFGYDDYYLGKEYLRMAKNGEVPDSIVNDKAARILRLIFLTGMNSRKPVGSLNSPEHVAANLKIAEEGIILLKNSKKILPLQVPKYKKVLVVGDNATKSLTQGGGSSELKAKDEVSPLRGIKERFGDSWNIEYCQGYESGRSRYDGADYISPKLQDSLKNAAIEAAKKADLVIYVGGLNKNHYEDCEGGDRRFYNMSYNQDELISGILGVNPNTVVVLISGNSVAMPWLNKVSTLIHTSYLGSEAGHALANVLSGDVNPSGKTVYSYAASLTDYPAHRYGLVGYPGVEPKDLPEAVRAMGDANPQSADLIAANSPVSANTVAQLNTSFDPRTHNGKGNEVQVYAEDVFLGYRYFDDPSRLASAQVGKVAKNNKLLFPFGYGLSYTTFAYSGARLSAKKVTDDTPVEVTVEVKNTGKVAGKEVVQLYVGDDKSSVVRPVKELKGFKKVDLQPGEQKTVTFTVSADDLKFYDESKQSWVVEPGTFKAYIGASSQDIKAALAFEY